MKRKRLSASFELRTTPKQVLFLSDSVILPMLSGDKFRLRPRLSLFGGAHIDDLAPFRTTSLVWIAGIALLSVPMLTLVDVPVGRWFAKTDMSREVIQLLELTSYFSHGLGIFLILFGIVLMAPRQRRYVPRLAVLAMGAGAVATLVKMFVLRQPPGSVNLEIATYDTAWRWVFDWSLDRVATYSPRTRAFPSGSMATASALAVGLWAVLPRGRWLFSILLIGTTLERMQSQAHFLSDVIGGAAFGLSWAYVCFHPKLLGSLFDRMESERRPRKYRAEASEKSRLESEKAKETDSDRSAA